MKDLLKYALVLGLGFLIGLGLNIKLNERHSTIDDIPTELADSISHITPMDSVKTVTTIEYVHHYHSDTIREKDTVYLDKNLDSTFIYSQLNDTCEFQLTINAKQEPNWIKLDYQMRDNFLIINTLDDTYVKNNNPNGTVTNVVSYSDKPKWKDKFTISPQVGVGYGIMTNKLDVYVGFGISYKF